MSRIMIDRSERNEPCIVCSGHKQVRFAEFRGRVLGRKTWLRICDYCMGEFFVAWRKLVASERELKRATKA